MTNVKLCSTAFNQKLIVVESKLKITLIEKLFCAQKKLSRLFLHFTSIFFANIFILLLKLTYKRYIKEVISRKHTNTYGRFK